jgi:hypothetical protein
LKSSYTEGFFYLDGLFYEGTGREGQSAVLAIQPETGKVVRRVLLADEYFGEGIVDWGPEIYEWTWTSKICFVYDRASFRLLRKLTYDGEGWGMTRTATQIVTSDGSSNLTFRDPATFAEGAGDYGARWVGEYREIERAGIYSWGNLGECLACGPDCADFSGGWAGGGVDRFDGIVAGEPEGGWGVGFERDCL